jgi:hypothetical protein
VSVQTAGWTWFDQTLQLTILAVSPVLILMLVFLPQPPYPTDFVQRIIAALVILAIADFSGEEIVSVRRVDIDSEGVAFNYPLHCEKGAWADLFPGPNPPQHGSWFVGRTRRRGGRVLTPRAHRITLEQARAILSHPSCPKWDLEPAVESVLRLTSRST